MIIDELASATWTRAGFIEVDAAMIGFIDAAAIVDTEAGRTAIESPSGVGMLVGEWVGVMAWCEEDGAYDVELLHDVDGLLRAVRVEFVTDIATLDGEWSDWQELTVTTGSVVACDPFCLSSAAHRLVLEVPTGTHRVQKFVAPGIGFLGIRLIIDS
jgi:hypothetical protein